MNKTKEKILNAGLKLYPDITLQAVANRVGNITKQGVAHYFPQGTLKDDIAAYAVKTGNSKIIVQLMAAGHPAADNLSASERIKHFNAIEN